MPQRGEQPEFGFVYPNPPFSRHFKQNIWGAFVMLAVPSNSSDFLSFKLKINKRHREHKYVCNSPKSTRLMGSPSGSLLEAPPPPSFGKITDFLTPLSLQAAEAVGEQREEEEQGKTQHCPLQLAARLFCKYLCCGRPCWEHQTSSPADRQHRGRQPQTSTSGNANLSPAHQGSTRGLT